MQYTEQQWEEIKRFLRRDVPLSAVRAEYGVSCDEAYEMLRQERRESLAAMAIVRARLLDEIKQLRAATNQRN